MQYDSDHCHYHAFILFYRLIKRTQISFLLKQNVQFFIFFARKFLFLQFKHFCSVFQFPLKYSSSCTLEATISIRSWKCNVLLRHILHLFIFPAAKRIYSRFKYNITRSSETNLAQNINNNLRFIDLFRSRII